MDDSLAIIVLLSPTSSTESRQQPRMDLAPLTRLSISLFLKKKKSQTQMLPTKQSTQYKMTDANSESYKFLEVVPVL